MSLPLFRDCLSRVIARKKTLLVFAIVYLAGIILGICFVKTPAFYEFHLNRVDRFLVQIVYSRRNVFLIFLERTAGCALWLALLALSGIHFVALAVPPAVLLYRSYTFGGSIAILCSVYGVSGLLVVFVLFLPIHLLTDAVFLGATVLSCGRAGTFRFCRSDLTELLFDFLALLAVAALICLLEMLLLLVIFHPVGQLF